jgi:membrane protein
MSHKMSLRAIWPLIKRTGSEWLEDKVPKMSAALAYYTAVAIAPLLLITMKIIGMVLGPKAAANQLHRQLGSLTDPSIADALQDAIKYAGQPGNGTRATILSVIIAFFGASGVFGELQDSLNTIWEVRPKPDRGVWGIIQDRFLSMTMVLGCAFLLLVSMFVSTAITGASGPLLHSIFGGDGTATKVIGYIIDLLISTAIITVLFAAIFKVLPDVEIGWRDVWLGGFVTAVLFQIGKYALGVYFAKATPTSAYGAAGSIVAVLLWACYSSYILFFGAEFTQVYANEYGSRIVPSPNAEPLTEEMRQQAGMPHEPPAVKPAPRRYSTAGGKHTARPRLVLARKSKPAAPRPHRARARSTIASTLESRAHRSYVARYVPLLAGVVVGRFFWKRHHVTPPTAESMKGQWSDAATKWTELATLLASDRSTRYAMSHGPAGRAGPSWTDLVGQSSK